MSWFCEPKARWIVIFFGLVICVLLLTSCATAPSTQKYVGSLFDSKTSLKSEESFSLLWENRTVYFGAGVTGGKLLSMINPFTMAGGRGGGENDFPLHISATLMDSLLIDAGLQHYANLTKMTTEEKMAFRSAYFQRYDVQNHLLIWCELRTTWTELFLDLKRWLIFIEDNAANQYEPVRILGEYQFSREILTDSLPIFHSQQRRPRWEIHHKTLMLCFPRRDFYANPILSEKIEFLMLVFQLNDDEKTRSEGMWVIKK